MWNVTFTGVMNFGRRIGNVDHPILSVLPEFVVPTETWQWGYTIRATLDTFRDYWDISLQGSVVKSDLVEMCEITATNTGGPPKDIQDPEKVCKKIKTDPPEAPSWAGQCDKYREEWEKKKNDKDKFKYAAGVRRRLMSMLPDAPKIEDAEEQDRKSVV